VALYSLERKVACVAVSTERERCICSKGLPQPVASPPNTFIFPTIAITMATSTENTHQPLLPFDWVITSEHEDPGRVCPNDSLILGTFAAVNAMAGILSLFFGNRNLVHKLTFGFLGTPGSKAWRYMWLLSVALNLGANAVIARLIQTTPGYLSTFSVGELMLFFTTRPRLGWLFLGVTHLDTDDARNTRGSYIYENRWTSSMFANIFAEFVLQLIAMYPMGVAAHFGAQHGYVTVWTAEYARLSTAERLMYGGAMYYLTVGALYLLLCLGLWGYFFLSGDGLLDRSSDDKKKPSSEDLVIGPISILLVTTWLASWLFWAGFVKLAGRR